MREARQCCKVVGPSLAPGSFPASAVLADPALELRDSNGTLLISDNDWQDNAAQAALITAAGLAPSNAKEAAIAATLSPGLYTALLAGLNNSAQEVLRSKNGAVIAIQSGSELTIQGGITLENGSGLLNNGTLRLKNNSIANGSDWIDNSISGALSGTGMVIFNSTPCIPSPEH